VSGEDRYTGVLCSVCQIRPRSKTRAAANGTVTLVSRGTWPLPCTPWYHIPHHSAGVLRIAYFKFLDSEIGSHQDGTCVPPPFVRCKNLCTAGRPPHSCVLSFSFFIPSAARAPVPSGRAPSARRKNIVHSLFCSSLAVARPVAASAASRATPRTAAAYGSDHG